jgi:hypothetical protein
MSLKPKRKPRKMRTGEKHHARVVRTQPPKSGYTCGECGHHRATSGTCICGRQLP